MQKSDGMFYSPEFAGNAEKVVKSNQFCFASCGLDHGHIYAMTTGLIEAGATLKYVYDPDPDKVKAFVAKFPQAIPVSSADYVLSDNSIKLVASAIRPDLRGNFALQCLNAGKNVFVDKPGFIDASYIDKIKQAKKESGCKYYIYFGERVHVEGALCVQNLIETGKLGKILNIVILAPHRLNAPSRPLWFWDCNKNGPILTDIGSHQIEQFLAYSEAKTAKIISSSMANMGTPDHPDFYDFGDMYLEADNGVTGYCRVDWFTPDGMGAWGDGRVFVIGTKATAEVRKYIDVARSTESDHVYFTDSQGENLIEARGKYGFRYFGDIILDCVNGTDNAIDPERTLEAMRIVIEASKSARIISRR